MKKLKKLTLKELSHSADVLSQKESIAIIGGSTYDPYTQSLNHYATSHGHEGGLTNSYWVNGYVTYDDSTGNVSVGAYVPYAPNNGAEYSGDVEVYVNGELVSTCSLDINGDYVLPPNSYNIGDCDMNIGNAEPGSIKVVVSTQQEWPSGSGWNGNVIPDSYDVYF